ncbi:hypothetical protein C2E23DRAFT_722981, partial [Lenzites betulinus]
LLVPTPQLSASVHTQSMMVEVRTSVVTGYVLKECDTVLDGKRPWSIPELSTLFPHGQAALVLHYDRFRLPRDKPLHLLYCSYTFVKHVHFNRAVAALVGCNSSSRVVSWPGTVVVLKYSSALCMSYEDMVEMDIDDVRAYFTIHPGMWELEF